MFALIPTATFEAWIDGLRDRRGAAKIYTRLARLEAGHFGDCKSVGGDVVELRVHFGPGYRVYFTRRGEEIVILLCGGDKDSQRRDVERAREIAALL